MIAPLVNGTLGTSFDASSPSISDFALEHDFAWSGAVLAVVSNTLNPSLQAEARFFDRHGSQLGITPLPTDTEWRRVAWTGDRFVVVGKARSTYAEQLVVAELAADGALLFGPLNVGGTANLGLIESIAVSPTRYVVGITVYQDPEVVVVDRDTHATVRYRLMNLGTTFDGVSVAYNNGVFAATATNGGEQDVQLLDTDGTPDTNPADLTTLPWISYLTMIAATDTGFEVFATIRDTPTTDLYGAIHLDLAARPVSAVETLGTPSTTSSYEGIRAVTFAGGVALAQSLGEELRVIQQCE